MLGLLLSEHALKREQLVVKTRFEVRDGIQILLGALTSVQCSMVQAAAVLLAPKLLQRVLFASEQLPALQLGSTSTLIAQAGRRNHWSLRHICTTAKCGAAAPASGVQAPLKVAMVGSGPAGFYCTDKLRKMLGTSVSVDIIEALPTPFGLVRSGVAPDHPDTKNVINKFSAIAAQPNVHFFGNVAVGSAVSLLELRHLYDAVVLAYGSSSDKQLGVSGEQSVGCFSAREFVNWYNGHPACAALPMDLSSVRSVGIVGLGNVALDCARILLKPLPALQHTDIADHALAQLVHSAVQDVHIVGRRGPVQTQFSGKELREVLSLANVSVTMHPEAYHPTEADLKEPRKSQKVR